MYELQIVIEWLVDFGRKYMSRPFYGRRPCPDNEPIRRALNIQDALFIADAIETTRLYFQDYLTNLQDLIRRRMEKKSTTKKVIISLNTWLAVLNAPIVEELGNVS